MICDYDMIVLYWEMSHDHMRFRYPTLSIDSDEFKEVWKLRTDALNHTCNKPKLCLFENRSVQWLITDSTGELYLPGSS